MVPGGRGTDVIELELIGVAAEEQVAVDPAEEDTRLLQRLVGPGRPSHMGTVLSKQLQMNGRPLSLLVRCKLSEMNNSISLE
mmetsp:Transcript_42334/g.99364  ORF Transcript_42334/g.99364 Transcript_42334/m.99364 type:complete len:82 (-) Transcript_42334:35-280(-)